MKNQEYNLINNQKTFQPIKITIDLQKENKQEKIKEQIEEDQKTQGKKEIKNYLKPYLPNKFIE